MPSQQEHSISVAFPPLLLEQQSTEISAISMMSSLVYVARLRDKEVEYQIRDGNHVYHEIISLILSLLLAR